MKILFVSAEVSPFAKVGGLADVAGSLPKELRRLGHDVRIAMPAYRMVEEDSRWSIRPARTFDVEVGPGWVKQTELLETRLGDVPVWLIKTDEWFNEADRSEKVYLPGSDQHLFFAEAVLESLGVTGWLPDVIHCNDWHTSFIPVLMRERRARQMSQTASVFTIHNLAYQGEFGRDVLDCIGLSHELFNPHQLETFGAVNFLKAGCVYSDQVNTVSPRYATEIQTPEFGCRLEGLMAHLAAEGRLRGILNGIDTDEFNPATDRRIARTYSADDPAGKAACRAALLSELGLPQIGKAPVMGIVSRLSGQKGIDLVCEAAEAMFDLPAQLVVLGTGDQELANRLRALERAHPAHLRFIERFDTDLAQRIYSGSDMFLMPSSFEPCGLGQMIALRYGTIPVVRHTGGLADTVFEGQNGFVLEERDAPALLSAVSRAHRAFGTLDWQALIRTAMTGDYGWSRSALTYVQMYEQAVTERRTPTSATA